MTRSTERPAEVANRNTRVKTYTIQPATQPVPLNGWTFDSPWSLADVLQIDSYPWYSGGGKQATQVRLLYDDEAIYAQFHCEDKHIFSRVVELNGCVHKDSCVELFMTIDPRRGPDYFNIEMNCCGTLLMGYGPQRHSRASLAPSLADGIRIATSISAPTKDESPDDDGWWIVASVPFSVIGELAGRDVRPASGDLWRANLYRCGGKTDPQLACWNHIELRHPDFHRPEFFGEMRFA